jgi:hypothetical protein
MKVCGQESLDQDDGPLPSAAAGVA